MCVGQRNAKQLALTLWAILWTLVEGPASKKKGEVPVQSWDCTVGGCWPPEEWALYYVC